MSWKWGAVPAPAAARNVTLRAAAGTLRRPGSLRTDSPLPGASSGEGAARGGAGAGCTTSRPTLLLASLRRAGRPAAGGPGAAGPADNHGPPEVGAGQHSWQPGAAQTQQVSCGCAPDPNPTQPNPTTHPPPRPTPPHSTPRIVDPQPQPPTLTLLYFLNQHPNPRHAQPTTHTLPSPGRSIMSEGDVGKRTQYIIEGLFSLRKAKWSG